MSGDRVAAEGQRGAFVIYSVDTGLCTVELRQIGGDFAISTIPWGDLIFLDDPDESRAPFE